MTFAVHFGYTPTDDAIAHLQHHLDDTISTTFSIEPPASADYQFLISGRPSTDLLDASPHLKTLLIPFAAVSEILANVKHQHQEMLSEDLMNGFHCCRSFVNHRAPALLQQISYW